MTFARTRRLAAATIAAMVILMGLPGAASAGSNSLAPPFDRSEEEVRCDVAAPECVADGEAVPATGEISAETHVVSPANGTLPDSHVAVAIESLFVTHHLDKPVDFVHYRLTYHVDSAHASVAGQTGNPLGSADAAASLVLEATHTDPGCGSCFNFHRTAVVSTETAPGARTNEDVPVDITLAAPNGQLPAGDVQLRVTMETEADISSETGRADASVHGAVASIVVPPPGAHVAPPFDDSSTSTICAPFEGLPGEPGCDLSADANPTTGELSVSAQVTSPVGGVVPGVERGGADAAVVAFHHLDEPTQGVHYTLSLHIESAEATVNGVLGAPQDSASAAYIILIEHQDPACDLCQAVAIESIVSSSGRTSVEDEDVTVGLTLHPFLGGELPAGDVRIEVRVQAGAGHLDNGTARATADLRVTGVKAS